MSTRILVIITLAALQLVALAEKAAGHAAQVDRLTHDLDITQLFSTNFCASIVAVFAFDLQQVITDDGQAPVGQISSLGAVDGEGNYAFLSSGTWSVMS